MAKIPQKQLVPAVYLHRPSQIVVHVQPPPPPHILLRHSLTKKTTNIFNFDFVQLQDQPLDLSCKSKKRSLSPSPSSEAIDGEKNKKVKVEQTFKVPLESGSVETKVKRKLDGEPEDLSSVPGSSPPTKIFFADTDGVVHSVESKSSSSSSSEDESKMNAMVAEPEPVTRNERKKIVARRTAKQVVSSKVDDEAKVNVDAHFKRSLGDEVFAKVNVAAKGKKMYVKRKEKKGGQPSDLILHFSTQPTEDAVDTHFEKALGSETWSKVAKNVKSVGKIPSRSATATATTDVAPVTFSTSASVVTSLSSPIVCPIVTIPPRTFSIPLKRGNSLNFTIDKIMAMNSDKDKGQDDHGDSSHDQKPTLETTYDRICGDHDYHKKIKLE